MCLTVVYHIVVVLQHYTKTEISCTRCHTNQYLHQSSFFLSFICQIKYQYEKWLLICPGVLLNHIKEKLWHQGFITLQKIVSGITVQNLRRTNYKYTINQKYIYIMSNCLVEDKTDWTESSPSMIFHCVGHPCGLLILKQIKIYAKAMSADNSSLTFTARRTES